MDEMKKHSRVSLAALRAGMHRNTARRYLGSGKLPSESKPVRTWRTRQDPFAEVWEEIAGRLEGAPELEAKALFEDLLGRYPGRFQEGQLRTFQRRLKQWRAEYGPPKEVFFPQEHRPGEAMQTDFTWCSDLEVTIAGEPFSHQLCHSVLPYSNWESATICLSESMLALRRGVQQAVFALGRVPRVHQTDNSTAATHELATGKRGFNVEYEDLMAHLGMEPRTIAIGQKHQNGDIEASHGALKRRLEQYLLLRGSRDFKSVEEYEEWLQVVIDRANRSRSARLVEELAVMRDLSVKKLVEYREMRVRVSSHSTIQVLRNTYSVPSRLKGEMLLVRVYEMHLEIYYGGARQLVVERLRGERGHRIDYRHIIWSLVKKPWAFARYRFREALFPSAVFRLTYDELTESLGERQADLSYLRILHLAAATMQCEVEVALDLLLAEGRVPRYEAVRSLLASEKPEVPAMKPLEVDLASYDELLVAEVGR